MADLRTRLTKKALVLAKVETTIGVDAVPSHLFDAIEVEEPNYTINSQVIERNYVADDLSPFPDLIGRKQATISFTSEIKGNGIVQSGNLSDAPVFARIMQACGYELKQLDNADVAGSQVLDPIPDFDNAPSSAKPTWAKGGTVVLTKPILYTVKITTGGASGVAQATVVSNDLGTDNTADDVAQTVTSGSPINLGSSGATVSPTFSGNLTQGSIFRVLVLPKGVWAKPISNNQKTLTIHLFMDGVLHKMTAALGNFSITAEAGSIAKVQFTFQGNFVDVADEEAPANPVYPETLPSQVELSNLTWGSNTDLVAQQWTFEQGNTLTPRPDVNSNEGTKAVRITERSPTGGFNPEATTEADHPFWDEIERGKTQTFFAKVGKEQGNTIAVLFPKAQISALPYGDRDGLRTYDVSFGCKRFVGNDESHFFFV